MPEPKTRLKAKCCHCQSEFMLCTSHPDRHSRDTLYCPECGQHAGEFIIQYGVGQGWLFDEMPDKAELTQPSTSGSDAAKNAPSYNADQSSQQSFRYVCMAQFVGIAMLAWALVPTNPYSYYIVLRFVICGIAAHLAYKAFELERTGWTWVLGITAVIYNPIIRVHLTRDIWSVVNVATIIVFMLSMWSIRQTARRHTPNLETS